MKSVTILFCFAFVLFNSNIVLSYNETNYDKYNKLTFEAMLQFKDKEFKKSLKNFEKALKLMPRNNVTDYFYAAAAAFNIGKIEKAKKIIINSIIYTNSSKEYFDNFNEFDSFRKDKVFIEINNNYPKYVEEFFNKLEYPEIYKEIDSLVDIDQSVRNENIDYKKMNEIDTKNINRLIEITKKYGWQTRSWLILWHQRMTFGEENYVWNFFKPYIDNEIKKGKMNRSFWTRFEDEKSLVKNKTQIYGQYWNQFDEYPIEDIENVDKRRTENGLPPLWYMEKIYNVKLPENYKKPLKLEL
jgi:tetratricopeptide (TPR) repeat protein